MSCIAKPWASTHGNRFSNKIAASRIRTPRAVAAPTTRQSHSFQESADGGSIDVAKDDATKIDAVTLQRVSAPWCAV